MFWDVVSWWYFSYFPGVFWFEFLRSHLSRKCCAILISFIRKWCFACVALLFLWTFFYACTYFFVFSLDLTVIYKRVVARKIKLTRRSSLFVYWINKINKRMKYLAGWPGGYLFGDERLLWSFNCLCDLCLAYLYVPDFKHRLQKILFVEKKWLVEK